MTLAPASRLGPYEVIAPLGAGGMGEVYRARDTRLGREVAIKVLPAEVASDPERLRRFEQEAKAVSALNHPHIVTLYEVGESDSGPYLVLERIDGHSLRELLRDGALPVKRVLQLGAQIAEGLAKAHAAGIVHRDLKPENVMVTEDGFAKILDFGLAKLVYPEIEGGTPHEMTTIVDKTASGMILGTLGYLSPEQAAGRPADFRADQFALGALLYELSTGERPFRRETTPESLAAVIRDEPEPLRKKNAALPAQLGWIVERCLAKDPDERYASTRDLARDLADLRDHLSEIGKAELTLPSASEPIRHRRGALAWGLVSLLALVVAGLLRRDASSGAPPPRTVRSSILAPEGADFDFSEGAPLLSPDGGQIAFLARDRAGARWLWVRPLAAPRAQALSGTEGANHPFWSPDGTALGYFQNKRMRRIEVRTGESRTLCDVEEEDPPGGSWGPDGTILFTPSARSAIYRVPAQGGKPIRVTGLDSNGAELPYRFPYWLPDGRHFLFLGRLLDKTATPTVFAASPGGGEPRPLVASDTSAVYSSSGHLLFMRGATLFAQRFDAEKIELSGEAISLSDDVQHSVRGEATLSLATDGSLLYQAGLGERHQLAWMGRDGRLLETVGPPSSRSSVELSHDGKRAALVIWDDREEHRDIWIQDFDRETSQRLSFEPGDEFAPIWSPDDRRVLYAVESEVRCEVASKPSDGSGSAEIVYSAPAGESPVPASLSADGKTLALSLAHGAPRDLDWDVALVRLPGGVAQRLGKPPFQERGAQLAPDGQWLAFESDESGRSEIFIEALPGESRRMQVSTAGGTHPRWRRDGGELFYLSPDLKLVSVPIRQTPTFEVGAPRILFEPKVQPFIDYQYDVSADGQRFLVLRSVRGQDEPPLTLVTHWTAELPTP